MSTFNYSRAQATARRLIEKFGNAATITRTAPNGTQSVISTKLCVTSHVTHLIEGSGVAIGDQICLFDDRQQPKGGDRVAWGNDSGVVVGSVIPFRVNGIDTTYFTAPVRAG